MAGTVLLLESGDLNISIQQERRGEKREEEREGGRKKNKGAKEEFSRTRNLSLRDLTFCVCSQW